MATVIQDNLWLCEDCHMAASGCDVTIVDQAQAKATEEGLARLAEDGRLMPDSDSETGDGCDVLMSTRCNCCNVLHVHGFHNRYALLGA